MSTLLPRRTLDELLVARRDPVPVEALEGARRIVDDVKARGEVALRHYAERFGELRPGASLVVEPGDLRAALERMEPDDRTRLERVAGRIREFAEAQRNALSGLCVSIPGGLAGHWVAPVQRAGCYAPGGRYPLPSSVLMTAVTARVAGVEEIWVASPKPAAVTLAAASAAGVRGVVAVGGAQAIAALAYGAGPVPACDAVVGPGNRYVTAAKQLVAGRVAIDTFAGASELLIVADDSVDPSLVAADLLAQAEHDPDAVAVLVTMNGRVLEAVEVELERQLADLPMAGVARSALANGGAIAVRSLDDAIGVADRFAPEHLQLMISHAAAMAKRFSNYGSLFIGAATAEVFGDYGAGPNHVLPTGGSARCRGGLSVLSFLRVRTWMRIDDPRGARELADDAVWFARLEGLEAHARAAERRRR